MRWRDNKAAEGTDKKSEKSQRQKIQNWGGSLKRSEFLLPSYIGIRNLESLFKFCSDVTNAHGDLEIDARRVAFVDPMGLTVLTALLSPICATRTVRLLWLSVNVAAYMDRMDFFKHCPMEGVEVVPRVHRSDLRNSLVEITTVGDAHETDSTASRLATALTGGMTGLKRLPANFNDGPDEFERYCHPIEYALTELLDNSLTHARREGRSDASVWVAAQYYSEDMVRIGITDNGCGILATLSMHEQLAQQTHRAAIELALKPFVSCNRTMGIYAGSTNQGVGLTTTCRISQAAGGGMTIVSGNAKYATGSGGMDLKGGAFWQGVVISFVCKRAQLPHTNPSALLPDLPTATIPAPDLRFSD